MLTWNLGAYEITFDFGLLLRWIVAYLLVVLVHELGHGVVGWLYGWRRASVHFGVPSDWRRALSLTFLPIPIHFHLGLGLFYAPPSIWFADAERNLPPARDAMFAAGGPIATASLLAIPAVRTEAIRIVQGITELRLSADTFTGAVAAWTLFLILVPLIPKRYRSVQCDSDGLRIMRFLPHLIAARRR